MSRVFGVDSDKGPKQGQESIEQVRPSVIPTGIPGFDDSLGQGLPSGNLYLLSGTLESCQILFAQEVLYNNVIRKTKVAYYTIENSSTDIINDMNLYKMNIQDYVDDGSWLFTRLILPNMKKVIDVLPEVPMEQKINLEGSLSALMNHFHDAVKEGRNTVIHLQHLIRTFPLDDLHNLLLFITGVIRKYGGIHFLLLTEGSYDPTVGITIKDSVDAVFEISSSMRGTEIENIVAIQKIRNVIPRTRQIRLALRENGLATETIRRVQ